jgi:hypothetical protein
MSRAVPQIAASHLRLIFISVKILGKKYGEEFSNTVPIHVKQ